MMKKLAGAVVGLAMLGLAAGAMAQSSTDSPSQQQPGSGVGGNSSGIPDTSAGVGASGAPGMAGQQQLEGRVLKADTKNITVEYMGAAIPLEVGKSTTFQGVKNAKEIKEGQQVRANFELRGNKNQLTSVEVISAAGGTGKAGAQGSEKK